MEFAEKRIEAYVLAERGGRSFKIVLDRQPHTHKGRKILLGITCHVGQDGRVCSKSGPYSKQLLSILTHAFNESTAGADDASVEAVEVSSIFKLVA